MARWHILSLFLLFDAARGWWPWAAAAKGLSVEELRCEWSEWCPSWRTHGLSDHIFNANVTRHGPGGLSADRDGPYSGPDDAGSWLCAPGRQRKEYVLQTSDEIADQGSDWILSFKYWLHKTRPSSTVSLEWSRDAELLGGYWGGSASSLWGAYGEQGDQWLSASVTVPREAKRLRFHYQTELGGGNLALADFTVRTSTRDSAL